MAVLVRLVRGAENTCVSIGGLSHLILFSDTRAAAAWNFLSLPWKPFFLFAFKAHKHINLLEIESASSLLRHPASEGRRNCRVLALTDSRVALGSLSKGRSSSRRVNDLLKKVAALCLCYGFQFDVVWAPTWGNPADAPSREQPLSAWRNALPGLPPVPPARLLSQQAENELRQLAEPFSANPCVQGESGCPPSSPTRPSLAASAFSAASSVWPEPR